MAGAWVLYPLVLVLVATGLGLLVDVTCGRTLPRLLIPSVGIALAVVVATLTTIPAATAPATPWILLALALAGFGLGRRRLTQLPDPWVLGGGVAVFAVCAAPVVLSGSAAWLGYFVDNDPAFHLVLAEQLLAHGRNLSNVVPFAYSSSDILLHEYLSTSYPTGTDVILAATSKLAGEDPAWTLQPFLAIVLALSTAALGELARPLVASRPLRALCAFTAALTGLVYAFYLEASLKELATAWMLTVTVATAVWALSGTLRARRWIAPVLSGLAMLLLLTAAAAPWLVPPVLAVLVALIARRRDRFTLHPSRRTAALAGIGAVVVIAVAIPLVIRGLHFIHDARGVLTASTNLGNLATPLSHWELFGIWPTGDFRWPIYSHITLIDVLTGIAVAAAVLGTAWSLYRRAWGPVVLILGNSVVAALLLLVSSPYAASKVLMIFATSVTLASMLGAVALHQRGRRALGWGLALVVTAGVLWTDALGYRDSSVAPRGRFDELAAIGRRFAGQGPAFVNTFDEYAVYFLRREGAEVPNTWGPVYPRPGLERTSGQTNLPWDPNDLDPEYLQQFRLIVLPRSPQFSRPPADFQLADAGRWYEVWRRTPTPTVLAHISLTSATAPPTSLRCAQIAALGRQAARSGARLAYVTRPDDPELDPATAAHPPSWVVSTENAVGAPDLLHLSTVSGTVSGTVRVPRSGRYAVVVEGSISEPISVSVAGRHIGTIEHQLAPAGQVDQVGEVTLAAGEQAVALTRRVSATAPGDVYPGYAGSGELLGPLWLVPVGQRATVQEVAPADARTLCGQALEWVEIVRG